MRFLIKSIFVFTHNVYAFHPLPLWYPIISTNELNKNDIHRVELFGNPYVLYKNQQKNNYTIHTDICPHQGASLSKGFLNENGHIHCPYHGFEFDNQGDFVCVPKENKIRKNIHRIQLSTFEYKTEKDFLYIKYPSYDNKSIPNVFFPSEEYDSKFVGVEGSILINKNYQTVCENLLDMLHISYVHSFGNKKVPLPTNIRTKRLHPYSFQTSFEYEPHSNTISKQWGKVQKVYVQNEYHLPTNTITRVMAGNIIKTVFTRSIPISKNKTLLYWKIYRNFWIDPHFCLFTLIGNYIIQFLMNLTIQEDVSILNNVYESHRNGSLIVKYDVTIQNFRRDLELYKI